MSKAAARQAYKSVGPRDDLGEFQRRMRFPLKRNPIFKAFYMGYHYIRSEQKERDLRAKVRETDPTFDPHDFVWQLEEEAHALKRQPHWPRADPWWHIYKRHKLAHYDSAWGSFKFFTTGMETAVSAFIVALGLEWVWENFVQPYRYRAKKAAEREEKELLASHKKSVWGVTTGDGTHASA